jgi:hypothetical protein
MIERVPPPREARDNGDTGDLVAKDRESRPTISGGRVPDSARNRGRQPGTDRPRWP